MVVEVQGRLKSEQSFDCNKKLIARNKSTVDAHGKKAIRQLQKTRVRQTALSHALTRSLGL